jgi:hypothetical protein
LEAARATSAAPKYFTPVEVSQGETWKEIRSHGSTPIPSSALLQPAGYVPHSSQQQVKKFLSSKDDAGLLYLELQYNKVPCSPPTGANNESGGDGKAGNGHHLDHGAHGTARRGPGGSHRGLGNGNAGRGNRSQRDRGNRPPGGSHPPRGNRVPVPRGRRLFRCPHYAAGLSVCPTSQCYKTAGEVQRIKDVRTTDPTSFVFLLTLLSSTISRCITTGAITEDGCQEFLVTLMKTGGTGCSSKRIHVGQRNIQESHCRVHVRTPLL